MGDGGGVVAVLTPYRMPDFHMPKDSFSFSSSDFGSSVLV